MSRDDKKKKATDSDSGVELDDVEESTPQLDWNPLWGVRSFPFLSFPSNYLEMFMILFILSVYHLIF